MKDRSDSEFSKKCHRFVKCWHKVSAVVIGMAALVWFLIRVIPKPSRASYPCQRAAFPIASAFVLWLTATLGGLWIVNEIRRKIANNKLLFYTGFPVIVLLVTVWLSIAPNAIMSLCGADADNGPFVPATYYNWQPEEANKPIGVAQGIYPGRVVMARDPKATRWAGNWKKKSDQWWLDKNTDKERVSAMLSVTLKELTGASVEEIAWEKIFESYNQNKRGLPNRGYRPNEVVAVKINLNNSSENKTDNLIDATPQMVLAMVRQLVLNAHIPQDKILVYDARRPIYPAILTTVWNEFSDVRFLQEKPAGKKQPFNPKTGDHSKLESAQWINGIRYSAGKYNKAKLIPQQIMDATYIINLALLKCHSYPYNYMEDGDDGQTAITMCGKNHAGSILGTAELHPILNTRKKGVKNAYSPLVDLAASPNLGAKTILYVLDGLYCGRKWRSYPSHFPNPPFNNDAEPYENPEWPACVLASQDGVALESVGLDIMYAQSKNNTEPSYHNVPRILIRENADDFLHEMAMPQNPPSGTKYRQAGRPVTSLGVHEHWDNDATMRYSRNLDPENGKGIELIYLPLESTAKKLPGKGLAQHDFFYAGEAKQQNMYIVRDGKIAWQYNGPKDQGEISDAVRMTNGNILFAHQRGITLMTPNKEVLWNYDVPDHCEVHTAQPIGKDHVVFVLNSTKPRVEVVNLRSGKTVKEFPLPVKNPKGIHGQFRHARLNSNGNLLVAHMDLGLVCEYDINGNQTLSLKVPGIWSVEPLKNGNILVCGGGRNGFARELDRKGNVIWEYDLRKVPDYDMSSPQIATRLENGNTIINNWFNQWNSQLDYENLPVQAIEVTPDKEIVWVLQSWTGENNLGPSTTIQLLNESRISENVRFGDIE